MDKGQILMDYRLAKNHKRQIPILADLNVCVRHADNSRNSGRGWLQAYVQYEWCGYFREENRD